ncbi:MAG: type IV toxin-antitoxin system AbiEi family antitoxin [Acidimicrobiales bacterium]|nr:type IV toxin-antitoxin system AbiEi family antitoxin [Acidimicrobiales bacterium]
MSEDRHEAVEPRELVDWLLARGRSWVTTAEAATLLGVSENHVAPTLARWRRRGQLFSPTKGLYVVVPPEYRPWGSAPASHFIDALMGHLGHDYYVALLSAAEVHGFAHQRPQVFQVMTPARLRERAFGRVRIRFITDASMAGRAVDIVNTPTGTMRVSAIETTVLDLLAHPRSSGGLSNVATIVGEMLEEERIDIPRLAGSAVGYPTSVIQRCGWLLDFMAHRVQVELNTEALAASITSRRSVLLDPSGRRAGEHDARWQVIVNATPEPDL